METILYSKTTAVVQLKGRRVVQIGAGFSWQLKHKTSKNKLTHKEVVGRKYKNKIITPVSSGFTKGVNLSFE